MNKKTLIIGGGILLILFYFGFNSYQLDQSNNEKYSTQVEFQKSEIEPINYKNTNLKKSKYSEIKNDGLFRKDENFVKPDKNETKKKKTTTNIKSTSNGQTFFKFSSTLYDIEVNGYTVETKEELTYHTIDLIKEIVKMESKSNGKWIEITYPIKKWYKEEGPYSTTYVFIIKSLGVQEFWWIPEVPSLGYDYDDGKRIACYNITRIK